MKVQLTRYGRIFHTVGDDIMGTSDSGKKRHVGNVIITLNDGTEIQFAEESLGDGSSVLNVVTSKGRLFTQPMYVNEMKLGVCD